MLCLRTEGTEAYRPSFRFPDHHDVVRVDATSPWPSCKRVRDEDPCRPIFIFLDCRLFLCNEAIDNTFSPPGEQDRDTVGGEMNDRAYECAEREQCVNLHTGKAMIALSWYGCWLYIQNDSQGSSKTTGQCNANSDCCVYPIYHLSHATLSTLLLHIARHRIKLNRFQS